MPRILKKETIADVNHFSQQLLNWAQNNETFAWLDSNDYPQKYSSYDKILALEVQSDLSTSYQLAFEQLNRYQQQTKDYLFGYLSYDLKNDTELLESHNFDGLNFPDLYFFQPKKLFLLKANRLEMLYDPSCAHQLESDYKEICNITLKLLTKPTQLQIKSRISEAQYYTKFEHLQKHIQRGDSYEINFCLEFFAEGTPIEPLAVFQELNTISSPPFATFFRHKNHYLLSASPERFVKKEGHKVISQPIKGTSTRSQNLDEDQALKSNLRKDPKERSENIMIVDLVRNDLSKTATINSVQVEELCEVYTFKQVHQLISTITSQVKKEIAPVDLIKSLFPMGSMTGAPKISTMKIIESLEESKRGVYAGSFGYFTPTGDFDFNVVIRSILYDSQKHYTSFSVGGAITAKSNPKKEYQECLLKAAAMKKVLTSL